jgi:trimethylamine corrinoid protein
MSTYYEQAKQSIIDQDVDKAKEIAQTAVEDETVNPLDLIENGFAEGIREMGILYDRGEIFLPELMTAAEGMKQASAILGAAIPADQQKKSIVCVCATVEGDIHDIGKGIVVAMFRANGFEVYDLGTEVPASDIIDKAVEVNADIIGTSALLNTTMRQMKKVEDELVKRNLKGKIKTIIGGAPVTARYAKRIGADGYSENANEAVQLVYSLVG